VGGPTQTPSFLPLPGHSTLPTFNLQTFNLSLILGENVLNIQFDGVVTFILAISYQL
jgi:hypothetical protein